MKKLMKNENRYLIPLYNHDLVLYGQAEGI